MNLMLGKTFSIPIAALNLFDTLAILLLIPIFEGFIYPYFKKKQMPLTMLKRIGWGFLFAVFSMVAAGILEIFRKNEISIPMSLGTNGKEYALSYQSSPAQYAFAEDNISGCASFDNYNPQVYMNFSKGIIGEEPSNCWQTCSTLDDKTGNLDESCIACDVVPIKSTLNVMWQVPQFLLVGISEILASVTTLEFFYSQAPESMRSFTAALNLFTTAIGSWVCIPIILLVNIDKQRQWLPADVNEGQLVDYFLLLAIIMLIDWIIFCYYANKYEYKHISTTTTTPSLTTNQNQFQEEEEGNDESQSHKDGTMNLLCSTSKNQVDDIENIGGDRKTIGEDVKLEKESMFNIEDIYKSPNLSVKFKIRKSFKMNNGFD